MDFNPAVSFKSSTVSSNTNLLDMYNKNNYQPSTQQNKEDKVVINCDLTAELKLNKERAATGTVVEGYVNGRGARFKVVSNDENETWVEGFLNKKYCLMHCKDKNYSGKYGNSDFSLTVSYNKPSKLSEFYNQKLRGKIFMPDYFTVIGTIGNKNINITLPNVKIPADEETRDLLTLILEDNGLKAQTINGEVKSLKFASSAVKNIKKKAEKREQMISNDIKPIFMQGISSATGMIIGSLVSAMLLKFGLKR